MKLLGWLLLSPIVLVVAVFMGAALYAEPMLTIGMLGVLISAIVGMILVTE